MKSNIPAKKAHVNQAEILNKKLTTKLLLHLMHRCNSAI